MSHSVEVCIKYSGTLGIALPHYESPGPTRRTYYGKLLTIDVSLSVNYLETDREMNFSDFQYFLGTRIAGQACANELLKLQVPLTNTIGLLLCSHLSTEVMVTVEVQELHARHFPNRSSQASIK